MYENRYGFSRRGADGKKRIGLSAGAAASVSGTPEIGFGVSGKGIVADSVLRACGVVVVRMAQGVLHRALSAKVENEAA
jgi:hypothetical protein